MTGLKRKTPLRSRTRLRQRNTKRLAKRRQEQFGPQAALCRTLPCHACKSSPPSDPHHVKSRAAGGKDKHCVNLCRDCHTEVHTVGLHDFQNRWMVDLWAHARDLEETVRREQGAA